jgi:hypothetical protein
VKTLENELQKILIKFGGKNPFQAKVFFRESVDEQIGDQIGLIFAPWAVVYFGHFYENNQIAESHPRHII